MQQKETEEKELLNQDELVAKQPYKKTDYSTILAIGLCFVTGGYLLFSVLRSVDLIDFSMVQIFNTIFISILMQAFPFMLIGVLLSSAMHVFISDEFIIKVFPTKYGLGFLTAMFAGLLFPVCECAIVPVMTRLVKKGVALPIAITFMLSAPIINPIVIMSTLYAFPGQPEIALMRVCFGLLIALITGLILFLSNGRQPVLLNDRESHEYDSDCDCGVEHDHHECSCHFHNEEDHSKKGTAAKMKTLFLHAGEEFFGVGKYLVLGAFMTSLNQTLVPREAFVSMGSQNGFSLFIMMAAAFLFSACSTSDAFIARSFMNRFSTGAIMGFLVFGPMMDVKNMLMLFANFKKSFVFKLSLLIFILNFVMLYFFAFLLF